MSEPSTPEGKRERRKKSGSARRKKQKSSKSGSLAGDNNIGPAPAPSSLAAYETYKLLPAVEHPYSNGDLALVEEILRTAEREWKAQQPRPRRGATPREPESMSLLHVLRAYETILQQRNISPDDDTYYYRFLLKLSLDGSNDWFRNFETEKKLNEGEAAAEHQHEEAVMKGALDAWRHASSGDQPSIQLVDSPQSDRFQMNGRKFEAHEDDLATAAAVNGMNGHAPRNGLSRSPLLAAMDVIQADVMQQPSLSPSPRGAAQRSSPRSPAGPTSPSSVILDDLTAWVGTERREWSQSPAKRRSDRHSPVPIHSSSRAGSPGRSPLPDMAVYEEPGAGGRVDLGRRASWGASSPVNGLGSRSPRSAEVVPLSASSPQDVTAYDEFKHLSDAFRIWSEHMFAGNYTSNRQHSLTSSGVSDRLRVIAVREVREEKARALELYIDALDQWALKTSRSVMTAWRRVVDNKHHARLHTLRWAWRRFWVGHQHLRTKLAKVADAMFHWQKGAFKSCWVNWQHSVVPPLRVVHPLLVLGIFMLRRQGRPRWMSTLDACEIGAHNAIVVKQTHQRRLEAGQDSLRAWYMEQIFGAWVQYTDECFTVLDSAVRHWAGRNWRRHFIHWKLYMQHVKYHTGRNGKIQRIADCIYMPGD